MAISARRPRHSARAGGMCAGAAPARCHAARLRARGGPRRAFPPRRPRHHPSQPRVCRARRLGRLSRSSTWSGCCRSPRASHADRAAETAVTSVDTATPESFAGADSTDIDGDGDGGARIFQPTHVEAPRLSVEHRGEPTGQGATRYRDATGTGDRDPSLRHTRRSGSPGSRCSRR